MKTSSAPYPYLLKFALYLKNPQLAQFPPNAEALTNADAIATNAKLKIPTVTTFVVPLEAIKDKRSITGQAFMRLAEGGCRAWL